ncbi:MAG: AbrB/MazE/SpoVT family DNA-binding domain-containing protein, partial [Candidatus Limnocylindrales bacterium]
YVEVSFRGGIVVLEPKTIIDASQAWFWSDAWQKGELEASQDIADGRTTSFDSDEAFLASLD